ncbi:MAG: FkbM family methyltransferase [Leptolyngbyaceae bacterium]|nr:FkbM family methyltransferase [Leptolyngbyaceae bacterium]
MTIARNSLFPVPIWQDLIKDDAPIILDVGANDGGSSYVFQRLFPSATIYAFEPDPRAIRNCKRRISLGNIDAGRFTLYEFAVSDNLGRSIFYQTDGYDPDMTWYDSGWDLSGSLLKPTSDFLTPTISFSGQIEVETITLDSWYETLGGNFKISLLWMDVQGAEELVLKGSQRLLNFVDLIYLECEERQVYVGECSLRNVTETLSEFVHLASYSDGNHLFKSKKYA